MTANLTGNTEEIFLQEQHKTLPVVISASAVVQLLNAVRAQLNAEFQVGTLHLAADVVLTLSFIALAISLRKGIFTVRSSHWISSITLLLLTVNPLLRISLTGQSLSLYIGIFIAICGLTLLSKRHFIGVLGIFLPCWLAAAATGLQSAQLVGDFVLVALGIGLAGVLRRWRINQILERLRLEQRVTELESLLPICACCKDWRDKDGEWHRIEQYLSENGAPETTHGMCPECTQEYYGGYLRDGSKTSSAA